VLCAYQEGLPSPDRVWVSNLVKIAFDELSFIAHAQHINKLRLAVQSEKQKANGNENNQG
jgi:hypothetical protein